MVVSVLAALDQVAVSVPGELEQLMPAAEIFTPEREALLVLVAFQVQGSPLATTVLHSACPVKLALVIVAVSSLFV